MAEEVREEAEPQESHNEQQQARNHGERDGCAEVLGRPLGRDRGRRGGGHQASHRHGADRQRTRGAEDRVDQKGRNGGIESHLRRQPRKQRVRERLRNQHDGDDSRDDQVVGERPARVLGTPSEDREITAEYVRHGLSHVQSSGDETCRGATSTPRHRIQNSPQPKGCATGHARYPIRSEVFSGSLAEVTFCQRSSSSSLAAVSRNSGAAHFCTSKSCLM